MNIRVTFFGTISARVGEQTCDPLQRQPALQLLLLALVLRPDTILLRQHIAFTLWPDTTETRARANLRQGLYALRSILGQHVPLEVTQQTALLRSDASAFQVDLWEFERAAASERYSQMIDLYRGALLDGVDTDWLAPARERYQRAYHRALERCAEAAEQRGDWRRAAQLTEQLLAGDPLSEHHVRAMMWRLARSGDRTAALDHYERFCRLLESELHTEPEPATRDLARQIAYQPPVEPPRVGVPIYPDAFIGRDQELAELQRRLVDPHCRLIVVVGLGGIGKTRLAAQALRAAPAIFPDGIYFCSLEHSTLETFTELLAGVFGLRSHAATSSDEQVRAFLYPRRLLLVLDGAEHVRGLQASLTRLLQDAPQIKLLLTSRSRLRMQGEALLPVEGLPAPDDGTPTALERSDAAQLLLRRARLLRPEFGQSAAESTSLAAICRQLQGIPLALELAAAHVRDYSCAAIAAMLAQNLLALDVASSGYRGLRATLETSWHALPPPARAALRRLAIFRDGFDREMAATVADAAPQLLGELVDRALLRCDTPDRYQIYEVVRHYLLERLDESGERTPTELRHLDCMLALAERSWTHFDGADEIT